MVQVSGELAIARQELASLRVQAVEWEKSAAAWRSATETAKAELLGVEALIQTKLKERDAVIGQVDAARLQLGNLCATIQAHLEAVMTATTEVVRVVKG